MYYKKIQTYVILFSIFLLLPCYAYGGNECGPITEDTIWTGTINITCDVTVESGATLTIESGSTVELENYTLEVSSGGALVIETGVEINAEWCGHLPIYGTATVNRATFTGGWNAGLCFYSGSSGTVTNCSFNDTNLRGDSYNDVFIGYNDIYNTETSGIGVSNGSPVISCNEITGKQYGIIIQGNSSPQIAFNSIHGNSSYGIYNEDSYTVNAQNNWWGDASGPSGEGSGTGDAVSTNVDFDPWLESLSEKDAHCVSIPTLSEWGIIIFMTLIMGIGVVILRMRRIE